MKITPLISIVLCLAIAPAFACHNSPPLPPCSKTHTYYTLTIWSMSCDGKPNFGHVDTSLSESATVLTVLAGTNVTIYAHANPGWIFEAYYIDNVQIFGHDDSVTITICKNMTLRVQFNPYPSYIPKSADPAPDPPTPQQTPSTPEHVPMLRWGQHPTAL